MLNKIFIFIIFIVGGNTVFSQTKSIGYWPGSMNRDGSQMDISLEFKEIKNQISGYFNSPSQKASGIPLDKVTILKDSVFFRLMSEPPTFFKCRISGNSITGQFKQEGFSDGSLFLTRSTQPAKKILQVDSSFISGNHKIACRIYFPKAKGSFPALVFMHGSGSEGMFANQYFAEYMASKGIVTLIQDKQGVGKSTGNWTTVSFDDLADDYINAVQFIKRFKQVNSKQIGIYGHSQGGTIAPLVASKTRDISFIIAAAAIGDSVYKQDLYRVENNLKSNGFNPSETKEAMDYYRSWLTMARTGTGFNSLDSLNKTAQGKKWYEWVEAPPKGYWIWKYYLATGNFYPLEFWKMLNIPIMLVYGENDQIEDIKTYIKNIDNSLSKNGLKNLTQIILPMAQHNLCIFPAKDDKFFWWYSSPGYTDLITEWILYISKNKIN